MLAQLLSKLILMNLTVSIWMRFEMLIEQQALQNMSFMKIWVLASIILSITHTNSAITTTLTKVLWRILLSFNTPKNLPISVKRHQWKSDTKTEWQKFSISYDLRLHLWIYLLVLNKHYKITDGKTDSNC